MQPNSYPEGYPEEFKGYYRADYGPIKCAYCGSSSIVETGTRCFTHCAVMETDCTCGSCGKHLNTWAHGHYSSIGATKALIAAGKMKDPFPNVPQDSDSFDEISEW